MAHVWGFTIVNDVTARDRQKNHRQWFLGKALDRFCPMGPYVTTRDEVDPTAMRLRTWVNGALRQDANTGDLIFDVPSLIETISAGLTLLPGDVIATGTPKGVGIGFDPPRFLKPGDTVTVEISGGQGRQMLPISCSQLCNAMLPHCQFGLSNRDGKPVWPVVDPEQHLPPRHMFVVMPLHRRHLTLV
jgi:2-keto-4-pentenoate hydratase/2-oxohepta-3-ene-1,7-dioic acid hydratase in catechol pathway